ncbi:MAG: DUF2508 family protein [Dethiobacteria bacterium]|mgnify:CR=1 FL=1|jgi:hypothetical protein
MEAIGNIIASISQKLLGNRVEVCEEEKPDKLSVLEEAHQDWQAALSFFDRVNEPGLIEHAIYNLNAAEKRYHFLLNEARKEKLTNPILGEHSLVEGGKYQKEDA